MIKIVTDSSSDLPKEIIKQYDITIVPLTVTIEGQDYLETIDLTPEEFFYRSSQVEELPKTSQPSPAHLQRSFPNLKVILRSFALRSHRDLVEPINLHAWEKSLPTTQR